MKKIVVLTGAGISAESGIKTFRDAGGLWEGHDVMEVASPEGWNNNKELVLDFYNQRRRQLFEVTPNEAHHALVKLENHYRLSVITQNVDDLHERAGSSNVIHLHGELRKARSTRHPELIYQWDNDLNVGDNCEQGHQLRPHIVWFGEAVPMIEQAALEISTADLVMIVGTSMQVYPAAGLIGFAERAQKVYYVDSNPTINYELGVVNNLEIISEKASIGVPQIVQSLLAL